MQTLFSTSFFDFRASEGAQVVSGRIWIYIVLTTALTTLVYAAWILLSNAMRPKRLKFFSRIISEEKS